MNVYRMHLLQLVFNKLMYKVGICYNPSQIYECIKVGTFYNQSVLLECIKGASAEISLIRVCVCKKWASAVISP
jgi:hypothetical protein